MVEILENYSELLPGWANECLEEYLLLQCFNSNKYDKKSNSRQVVFEAIIFLSHVYIVKAIIYMCDVWNTECQDLFVDVTS